MNTVKIEWNGLNGHKRTNEETLYALAWCVKHRATVSFAQPHVCVRFADRPRLRIRAYDLADCVKACIETYNMPE